MLNKNRKNLRRIQLGVKDPQRSIRLRSESLLQKASDLALLGARVAIYIDRVIDGQHENINFKTTPDFRHAIWESLPQSERLGPENFGFMAEPQQHPTTEPAVLGAINASPDSPKQVKLGPDLDASNSATSSREPSPSPQAMNSTALDDFNELFQQVSDATAQDICANGASEPVTPGKDQYARSVAPTRRDRTPTGLRRQSLSLRSRDRRRTSSPFSRTNSPRRSLSSIKWFED